MRSRFCCVASYFIFSLREIKAIVLEWIKIVLFEKNKIKKQKSILMGIFDFVRNKYEKFDN